MHGQENISSIHRPKSFRFRSVHRLTCDTSLSNTELEIKKKFFIAFKSVCVPLTQRRVR